MFTGYIRSSVSGSLVVAEVLQAVLDEDQLLINQILSESPGGRATLVRFVVEAKREIRTLRGRALVRQVASEHAYISGLPTDDISLRRVFNAWRRSEHRKAA